MESFLTSHAGLETFAYPGAASTEALGLNNHGEVVGVYTTGSGSTAQNFGFTWTKRGGFTTIDDPNGMGMTTVNGINDQGDLVGFYVDSAGNTDGMLVTPRPIDVLTNTASTVTVSSPGTTALVWNGGLGWERRRWRRRWRERRRWGRWRERRRCGAAALAGGWRRRWLGDGGAGEGGAGGLLFGNGGAGGAAA